MKVRKIALVSVLVVLGVIALVMHRTLDNINQTIDQRKAKVASIKNSLGSGYSRLEPFVWDSEITYNNTTEETLHKGRPEAEIADMLKNAIYLKGRYAKIYNFYQTSDIGMNEFDYYALHTLVGTSTKYMESSKEIIDQRVEWSEGKFKNVIEVYAKNNNEVVVTKNGRSQTLNLQ